MPSKNTPKDDSGDELTGSIDDAFIELDFAQFEGAAKVVCTDLLTGDSASFPISATGTSKHYIGEVSGLVRITVTTGESSYECVTLVE